MSRDGVVSPYFSEEAYKGQDVVHWGVRIPLGMAPEEALAKFSRNAQRICSKGWEGTFRELREEDLDVLRSLWFDPNDPTFPREIGKHMGIVGVDNDGNVIAGAIWSPEGANLFLHQLVAGERGKELQMPTRLIWESVKRYHGKYRSLDIGVSYNPLRYGFFMNFAVEQYPIILKKPFYVPVIRLSPFRRIEEVKPKPDEDLDYEERRTTFLPRASYGIYAALRHIGVKRGDQVCVVKTFGSNFISSCVTRMIEKTGAAWDLRSLGDHTKAVVAVHEFGIPVFQEGDLEMVRIAHERGIPVIEDCAWRFGRAFDWSDYQVYSLQKTLGMNYGAFLLGAHIPDEKLWEWGVLDFVKRERLRSETEQDWNPEVRKRNWMAYHDLVVSDGMTPDDCYYYQRAVADGTWVPTVYLQRFASDEEADAIVSRLEDFGIQAGRYWGEPVVYLPIHQNMTLEEVRYMFAVVRGYFNLCRDWGKA